MIQIFLTDGRILFDLNRDLRAFNDAISYHNNDEWVNISTPSGKEVVSVKQITSYKEKHFDGE